MGARFQRWISRPALVLGATAIAGLFECLALARSRRSLASSQRRLARR